ncbi:hypothetical protein Moror_13173 [Moniliophthora roreri MCA 2997]|uniref:PLAC8-domain-containing protein n=1 Tax=Moniliophthora roreri (strain MCA 2997) TaxID=1381753 RepID=V2X829_MONRO|nr:hypothetical protein Moror_13173 [Moniliophthora roreri MCA 2997]
MEKGYSNGSNTMTMQPGYTPQMSIGGGNRNVKNKPLDSNGKRDWSVGLCSCGDEDGGCFYAWCCPCIVHGQNKQRFEHLQRNNSPDPEGGSTCGGDCWLHCCLTCFGFGWVLQMMNRTNVRERYGIEGGFCGDLCTALCCTPCELAQERIEIQLEEQSYSRLPQHA